MSQKQRGLFAVAILLIGAVLISSCTFSLSQAPAETPTLIPTGLFVSPFPSVENPMEMIEEFARQTAAAQTVIASGGTPATPVTVVSTVLTPQTGATPTPTISTPTNVVVACTPLPPCPAGQTMICGSGSCPGGCGQICAPNTLTFTPVTPGAPVAKPNEWILKKEEFPFCIARRYGVNPKDLLAASGLTSPDIYYEGQRLVIPQNSTWPAEAGPIALRNHPDTYTVTGNSDTTVYGVACKYGNVLPRDIAQLTGISESAILNVGQQIRIP